MRCLEPAALDLEVESREVDQAATDDEELRSPYVDDDELDIGRWAHDAALLALPTRFLCRPDCAGLCPVCGDSLNDADPADHEHDTAPTPAGRLKDLKLDWSAADRLDRAARPAVRQQLRLEPRGRVPLRTACTRRRPRAAAIHRAVE